jgi:hypothetical protein
MALVRRGTKVYCYESYRAGGRVTSRYIASGAVALACAWLVADGRRKEARLRARHRRRLAALNARLRDQQRRARRAWRDDRAAAGAPPTALDGGARAEGHLLRTLSR